MTDSHAPAAAGISRTARAELIPRGRGGAHPYPTVAERQERGRLARAEVPRRSQGQFDVRPDRRDPVEILQLQAASRVPELVPIRYGRMATSPFAFLRGAAAVMAADLAPLPLSGIRAQICGDAHLLNFGVFSTPERSQLFDINDFDETLPGPWEWDLKRLAASTEVAARSNGYAKDVRQDCVRAAVRDYRAAMAEFAEQRTLDVWYASLPVDKLVEMAGSKLGGKVAKALKRTTDKALTRDSLQAFGKLTETVGDEARFVSHPPLLVPVSELVTADSFVQTTEFLSTALREYRRTLPEDRRHLLDSFRFVDMARKVVGVGSVGTRAWVLLLVGRDNADPLLLQVKEAQQSVLEPYVGRASVTNCGQRVVAGQRLMQTASDIFLGWYRVPSGLDGQPRDFYFRQLRDGKGSADVTTMRPAGLATYAGLCGWTLARAHARSGDRIAISSYLGRSEAFDDALVSFAVAYADQTERDHAALETAIRDGRIEAISGV